MIFYSLPIVDGRYELPCCKMRLVNANFPVRCSCPTQNLLKLIESCPYRGEATGEKVDCNCPSFDRSIYTCTVHQKCTRHKLPTSPVQSCIACEEPRKLLNPEPSS